MSSRRSARASAANKRLSYREDSDGDNQVDDLTEDEYQDNAAASADEAHEDDNQDESPDASSDVDSEQEESARSPKRRKKNTSAKSTPAKNGSISTEWAPGVTRIVTKLVGPPTSGHVPKGELSPNVLKFLKDLQANNEREWFAQYDAVYRYCWKNFGEFTEAVLSDIMEKVDDTVPWLPNKDILYRIYRDVRFSNDKTPYKTSLCASFSRGGRKGPFAGYHVLVKPDGRSFFAAGRWEPNREDLAVIRQHILDDTQEARELKAIVASPDFVDWFGPPKGHTAQKTKGKKNNSKYQPQQGQRCNLWGGDNELKVAPKIAGVDKTHKDIDWLKLRSFCAIH